MNQQILMISGPIGSGKTTLTNKLFNYFGLDYTMKLAFADKLKGIAHELYGVPWDLLNGSQEDKDKFTDIIESYNNDGSPNYYTVRGIICKLSDNMKLIDNYCWCRPVANTINSCYNPGNGVGWQKMVDKFLISDLRFPFEYEYIKNNCPHTEIKTLRLTKRDGKKYTHNSEISMNHFQYGLVIDNTNITPEETFVRTLDYLNWKD